jgi:GntR family transcriptional regulator, transcriptional repressor for pyruvate dehydrogenase complex
MPSAKWSETQAFRPCWDEFGGAEVAETSRGEKSFGALRPVEMRTGGQLIAERLVTAIALGEFEPGQRLPAERELAATLEVSRTTAREALQRLHAGGYVVTRRGRDGGTFIQDVAVTGADEAVKRTLDPRWEELTELLDYRRLIESLIARTAAQRRDSSDIAAITAAVERYTGASSRADARIADHAMHQAIARATHNERLVDLSARIRREVGLGFDAEPYTPQMRQRALRQHPALANAVIAGNPSRAANHATSHFSLTEGALVEVRARLTLRTGDTDAHRASE